MAELKAYRVGHYTSDDEDNNSTYSERVIAPNADYAGRTYRRRLKHMGMDDTRTIFVSLDHRES